MALPELDVARVQRWCAARVPEHARHQVRIECEVAPRHLTIVERRAPWREDFGPEWTAFPIARLRYTPPTSPGPCTGATATFASTSTSQWLPHTESKIRATRQLTCLHSGGANYSRHGGASSG